MQLCCNARIVVLDDFFPHPGSSFRFEEFRRYLDAFPNAVVATSGKALHLAAETRPPEALIAEYLRTYPQHAGRVIPLKDGVLPTASLYYFVFFHLLSEHFAAIEASGSSFACTLYPGGGLGLGTSDAMLRRAFGSPAFQGALVTQDVLRAHLVENGLVDPTRLTCIYGGVCPPDTLAARPAKRRYGFEKPHLDLCFLANRYTPDGSDKGYDLFVGAAQLLHAQGLNIRFHVGGPFDASVIALGDAASHFTFHGFQSPDRLPHFFADMDAILSPTRPDILNAGAFDGFPTGCTITAGLCRTAMICTDELALNRHYVDGRDIVLIKADAGRAAAAVGALYDRPADLARIGAAARTKLLDLFSLDRQMAPRLQLLERWAFSADREASRNRRPPPP